MGATRYKFEGKEIQLCNGSTELPKFVDDIFDFWSHVDPEPLDKGQCINAVADKLFKLLTHYYRDQVKFASKKKRNNAPQIKFLKHFKIWMYAILFCGHETAVKVRKHLKEPKSSHDRAAMKKYRDDVITFCSDAQLLFNCTSDGIHNPTENLSQEEILEQLRTKFPQVRMSTLVIILDVIE